VITLRSFASQRTRGLGRVSWLALPLLAGCFATRSDLRIVQGDLLAIRSELLRADSSRTRQLVEIAQQLRGAQDSLMRLSGRSAKFEGDSREGLYATKEQLLQIQVLLGQSQERIRQLQAQLEATAESNAAATNVTPVIPPPQTPAPTPRGGRTPPPRTTPPPSTPTVVPVRDSSPPATPGPNQLYQLALDQLRRGSAGTARAGFQDLLRQYPTSDLAADAQFYIAESYASERNTAAADAAYDEVARRYPTSQRAPTAAYKRAKALVEQGNGATARPILEGLIARWPRSDEADLAQELLRTIR
jgi:tol-pal system protein YbgF